MHFAPLARKTLYPIHVPDGGGIEEAHFGELGDIGDLDPHIGILRIQAAQRLDDEHLKRLIESCKGYFNYNRMLQKRCLEKGEPVNEGTVRSMTRLIGMVRDPAEQERLMKYYYLK